MSEASLASEDDAAQIETIEQRLAEAGYELALTDEGVHGWYAALLRIGARGPQSAPFAVGQTALEAARNAWVLYRSTPSLSSFSATSA